ncbi:MAG TPA: PolC-type DNA polymerase III [Pseudogracilibacillus sp.]|nr:PolC-type DNA polymerase III [Pseudogracilibacillus sp.]
MTLSKEDKLSILLDQLHIEEADRSEYFANSSLAKVIVKEQEQLMHFYINIEKPLPFDWYTLFITKLKERFENIAKTKVSFTLTSDIKILSEKDIQQYWNYFVKITPDLIPNQRELLLNQPIQLSETAIIIHGRNKVETTALRARLTDSFKHFTDNVGLGSYALDIRESETVNLHEFREKTLEQDRKRAIETMQKQQEIIEKTGGKNADIPTTLSIGRPIQDDLMQMQEIVEEERKAVVQGYVFAVDLRKLKSDRYLLIMKVTDYTDSLEIKMFSKTTDESEFAAAKEGIWIKARGRIQTDSFSNELTMMANDVQQVSVQEKTDDAPEGEKRIELHAHTTMSQLDAVVRPAKLIEQAAKWGHEAIAITDHNGVQAFPEAFATAKKNDIKMIYGLEANIVDDGAPIAYNPIEGELRDQTYVVFDVETTGLSPVYDTIIELAGVKMYQGEIIDRFERFANPHQALSDTIIRITGITDDMLVDAPEVGDVLEEFHEWVGDSVLVAHNATFDIGFLNQGYEKIDYPKVANSVIDTLELARFVFPQMGNHRLNTLCKHLNVELVQHHRAVYDAEATSYMFWKLIELLEEDEITCLSKLNDHMYEGDTHKFSHPFHATILVQNEIGLKNLYKLVSLSHIKYFYRTPRIPRSVLSKYREGLLIGSACEDGEVFDALLQKSVDEVIDIANFYDFLEVQPPENYHHLIQFENVQNEAQIIDTLKNIVELGEKTNIPVLATGNVHHLHERDKIYREILIASQKGNRLNRVTLSNTAFRTTHEMLQAFSFLNEAKAKEIVVTNTHQINDQIETISPLKEDLYTPTIEGADEDVRNLTYETAKSIYGDPLPAIVEERIEKELKSIIGHGFAVIYLISHKLVKKSLIDGYLVGSRGSVGSSLVATMTEITEVNPLPAHYACLNCNFNEFFTEGEYASGFDLPDKECPKCGEALKKDGQDIPFETFLGFKGDKVPDIDLNFSGEYQPRAHDYTRELFGEDYVFRAGTIGTIATKTAYGYVKGYQSDKNLHIKAAEVDRLVTGCEGVKRTTGQHPGGIIVVPNEMEIYDFTPIQFPADDTKSEWKTTHFDYRSIEDNLLKLDILGHDDPTVIRMLQDLSGIDPQTVPIADEKVMGIFSSPEPLGVTAEQIECSTGTLGVPEFGTGFVRQMLEETRPSTFAELVIISGLSHGTDVWLGNAQELIRNGTCEIGEVIGCRDDIMVYLMQQGVEASLAFTIMESVRKGRGLTDEWIEAMKEQNVPDWYINSCQKIKYMFPKAHAAAYVLMAVRIAYFKVYHPILFYAAYFSIRAADFELDTMVRGSDAIRKRMREIKERGNDAAPKERTLLTVLEVALEMCERGFSFSKVDLYRSDATEFIVEGNELLPPFNIVEGLGTNAAINIVKAREDGEFLSKEDLRERSRISKTVLDYLDKHGCLDGMADENQLSLF